MNKFISIFFSFIILSCSSESIYSGKILNQENIDDLNYKNKEILINKLGKPSFIDPLENKFFYYSEKKKKGSILKDNIEYSYVFVFKFDENNNIINTKVYDLKRSEDIKIVETETSNEVVKRGLLERIFGGVGSQQELPTTP